MFAPFATEASSPFPRMHDARYSNDSLKQRRFPKGWYHIYKFFIGSLCLACVPKTSDSYLYLSPTLLCEGHKSKSFIGLKGFYNQNPKAYRYSI